MSVSFRSVSRRLADDVAWLVRSLGGRARVLPKKAAFDVSIALPEEYGPFRLARKADRMRPRPKYTPFRRGIRAVEYVGRKQVQCISVAHPSHAYVTDNFTVTHNTMVALRAMLAVVDAGGQAAMLAPTEVLAQQHHRSITEMMGELAEGGMLGGSEHSTKVVLLTGSMGAAGRRQALLDLVTGEAGIVIGTHALIEDKVQFHDLGLVVVDEQHRFGVEQRDALRGKGKQPPHLLVMTATPIPRTVAMTVFGDLETSVLDQLPAGRSPIASHVVPAADKPHFLTRAWSACAKKWRTAIRRTWSARASVTTSTNPPTRRRPRRSPPRTRPRSARPSPSSTSPSSSPGGLSKDSRSRSCTAVCSPTTRTP